MTVEPRAGMEKQEEVPGVQSCGTTDKPEEEIGARLYSNMPCHSHPNVCKNIATRRELYTKTNTVTES